MTSKYLIGGLITIIAISAGLFWWQSNANSPLPIPNIPPPEPELLEKLPKADANAPQVGPDLPSPPVAPKLSREERRFNRYDLDGNSLVTRTEMMASRTKAFKKLDVDGNNLLTFEEWAIRTSDKFVKADQNKDLKLTRGEFKSTRSKPSRKPKCKC